MTKPLPARDVEARVGRSGPPRLSAVEAKALAGVEDEGLRKLLGELLRQSAATQENFETIEQWFPVQPADVARRGENQGEGDTSQFWLRWLRKGKARAASTIRGLFDKASGLHELRLTVHGQDAAWPGDPEHEDASRLAEVRVFASDKDSTSGVLVVCGGPIGGSAYVLRYDPGSGKVISDFLKTSLLQPGKGTLVTADGVESPRSLAVGADGKILVADSTAEGGLRWKTAKEAAAEGPEGRWASLRYEHSTNTEETDPTAGKLKFNAGKTALFISETDKDGGAIASYLAAWDDSTTTASRGIVILRKIGTPATFAIYSVSGALTDKGTWDTLPVALLSSGGAFANGDALSVEFYRTGDKGAEGAAGAPGAPGAEGRSAGIKYTYSTNIESSDPGAGKFKLNKTTLSEATVFRISETDGDANALAAYLATIDDSTSTVKGTIVIRKVGVPTVFAIFQTSGILNDNGTWDSFTVAHVASNGLANNDVCTIEFFRTGDKGTGLEGGAAEDLEGEWPNLIIRALKVTTGKIAALAVTAAKLGEESVETAKIKLLAVTTGTIAALAVTEAKIGELAVSTIKIAALAVTEAKLAAEAVSTAKLKLEAVTTATIANLAVTAAKLGEEAVETVKIKAEAVTEGKLANLAVTAAKLAAEAVETAKIKAEAVTEAKIANLAVATGKIAALAVTAAKLAEEAVETAKIKALAVTEAKLAAEAVAEAKIKNLAVATGKLAAEAVTEAKIAADAVNGAKIKLLESEALRWFSAGSLRQTIKGINSGANYVLELVTAVGLTAAEEAKIFIEGGGAGAAFNRIRINVGTFTNTLLDREGKSEFLRLTSLKTDKINYGTTAEIGAGATITVNHGLGVTPKTVILTPITASANEPVIAENPGAVSFKVKNTGGVAIFAFWLAVG